MKTLKDFANILYNNEYKEIKGCYYYVNGYLEEVTFAKKNYDVILSVEPTPEMEKHIDSLELGDSYEWQYEDYIVTKIALKAPICNTCDFFTGETDYIFLSLDDKKYPLSLFEKCLKFQQNDLVEQEVFIMSQRIKHLTWVQNNLKPLLKKYDYNISYCSLFDTHIKSDSHLMIIFNHLGHDYSTITITTDCITGNIEIFAFNYCQHIDITEIYEKNSEEIFNILLNKIWKVKEEEFGYIYNNDPHETKDTYPELLKLHYCIDQKKKVEDINFNVIPERYNKLVETYNKL